MDVSPPFIYVACIGISRPTCFGFRSWGAGLCQTRAQLIGRRHRGTAVHHRVRAPAKERAETEGPDNQG